LDRENQKRHEFLYWESPTKNGSNYAVRKGRWKLQRFGQAGKGAELYDLEADPAETTNVATDNVEIVYELTKIILQEHTEERKYPADNRGLGVDTYVK
jgi:arylsulfatase A-like enzyme